MGNSNFLICCIIKSVGASLEGNIKTFVLLSFIFNFEIIRNSDFFKLMDNN